MTDPSLAASGICGGCGAKLDLTPIVNRGIVLTLNGIIRQMRSETGFVTTQEWIKVLEMVKKEINK